MTEKREIGAYIASLVSEAVEHLTLLNEVMKDMRLHMLRAETENMLWASRRTRHQARKLIRALEQMEFSIKQGSEA